MKLHATIVFIMSKKKKKKNCWSKLSDEGDVESLASSDVMVLEQDGKGADEETDLSLTSTPSLPDDLPAIKLVFFHISTSIF